MAVTTAPIRRKPKEQPLRRKKHNKKDTGRDIGPCYNIGNPGMIMGRSIAFAKFTHDHYMLCGEIEPCWKHIKTKVLSTSSQVYLAYMDWLKCR